MQTRTASTADAFRGLTTRKMGGMVYRAQLLYVRIMMWLIGRLIQAASAVDPVIRMETAALPANFTFAMRTRSGLAGITLAHDGRRLVTRRSRSVEGTAQAFANDRMTIGGNAALTMKIVRCPTASRRSRQA